MAMTFLPQFTPRRKYYAYKTIWFCEEINNREIKLLKIEPVEQLGGIFTKRLLRGSFEQLRKKMILAEEIERSLKGNRRRVFLVQYFGQEC